MSNETPSSTVRTVERGPQSVVCAGISTLVRERWGRGPSRSRAYWAGPDVLLVLLDDAHTDSERTLMGHEHAGDVLAGRRQLAELAEPDLRRIAQSATGRRVRAVLSQSSLEPALSTHVFVFEPNGRADDDDRPLDAALRRSLDDTAAARALRAEGEQARRQSARERAASQAAREEREEAKRAGRSGPGRSESGSDRPTGGSDTPPGGADRPSGAD